MKDLYEQMQDLITRTLESIAPEGAIITALESLTFNNGQLIMIAIGKAAYKMAKTTSHLLKDRVTIGVVITKHAHAKGPIGDYEIYEASHPYPDHSSYLATEAAIDAVSNLTENDNVLMLISGGGSSLFEKPLIPEAEYEAINESLLKSPIDIVMMNTIRKRLSAVKGGKFALLCSPAKVFAIVLSDVVSDRLDIIASGPVHPDETTVEDALRIANEHHLQLSKEAWNLLSIKPPKIPPTETRLIGNVRILCEAAESILKSMGYETHLLTTTLSGEAKDIGLNFAALARLNHPKQKKLAILAGGESVVNVIGDGLGGRNQELVLSAAEGIRGLTGCLLLSFSSDGTDGPTDAAGGYVDWNSYDRLTQLGISPADALSRNDSYHVLEKIGALIKTGPTGTNINDLTVLLIDPNVFKEP
jgi:hydroxypyruvate reductase